MQQNALKVQCTRTLHNETGIFCGGFVGFGRRKSEGRLNLNTEMICIEQGDVFVFVCPGWNRMNSKSVTLLKGTEGKERTEIYPKKGWCDVNVKCLSLKFEQLWTWEKNALVWERPMWEYKFGWVQLTPRSLIKSFLSVWELWKASSTNHLQVISIF